MKKITVISFICIIIDQLIKIIVTNNLALNTELIIIDNFFSLTNVQNDGAAFSILSGNRIFLICVSLCALILLYFLFVKDKKLKNIDNISIVGFNNTPLSAYQNPPLATVDINAYELGYSAAKLLINNLEGKEHAKRHYIVDTEFIERESFI